MTAPCSRATEPTKPSQWKENKLKRSTGRIPGPADSALQAAGGEPDTAPAANFDATIGASVNEWVNVLRRARLGPNVKLVGLTLASYANSDGTNIFPGIARLAWDCGIDYRTARRALAALREAGLVETVTRGARRAGRADKLRLILAEDLLERCDVPDPDAARAAIEKMSARERSRSTGPKRPIEAVPGADSHGSPVTHENGSIGQTASVLQVTGDLPPSIRPTNKEHPPELTRVEVRDTQGGRDDEAAGNENRIVAESRLVNGHWRDPLAEARRQVAEARATRSDDRNERERAAWPAPRGADSAVKAAAKWLAAWSAETGAPPLPADWPDKVVRHLMEHAPAGVRRPDSYVQAALSNARKEGRLADFLPNELAAWEATRKAAQ